MGCILTFVTSLKQSRASYHAILPAPQALLPAFLNSICLLHPSCDVIFMTLHYTFQRWHAGQTELMPWWAGVMSLAAAQQVMAGRRYQQASQPMQRTIPRGWLQWLLPAVSRGSRAAGLPAMLGAPWQPDEPRSSRGRQLQLHWLSGGSAGWGPNARCQRWVQAWRCMSIFHDKAVISCTAPRIHGQRQLTHLVLPAGHWRGQH